MRAIRFIDKDRAEELVNISAKSRIKLERYFQNLNIASSTDLSKALNFSERKSNYRRMRQRVKRGKSAKASDLNNFVQSNNDKENCSMNSSQYSRNRQGVACILEPESTDQRISKCLSIFADAASEVYMLMSQDSLQRFLSSQKEVKKY